MTAQNIQIQLKKMYAIFLSILLIPFNTVSQEVKKKDFEIEATDKPEENTGSWWMWVIGIAVFIIIVLIMSTDKEKSQEQ